jgi:hypothetical protein
MTTSLLKSKQIKRDLSPKNICTTFFLENENKTLSSKLLQAEETIKKLTNILEGRRRHEPTPKEIAQQLEKEEKKKQKLEKIKIQEEEKKIGDIFISSLGSLLSEVIKREKYLLNIGKVIYNLTRGSRQGFVNFMQIVVSINNNLYTTYEKLWPTFRGNTLSVKTLVYEYKQENKDLYDKCVHKWIKHSFDYSDNITDLELADVIYRFFWLDFICSDMKGNSWWYYSAESHRFILSSSETLILKRAISTKLIDYLLLCKFKLEKKHISLDDKNSKTNIATQRRIQKKINHYRKVMENLQTSQNRNKAIKLSIEQFYMEDFDKIRDNNVCYTGWSNCVIEVNNTTLMIRNGKPEDYITKCGNIEYKYNFNEENTSVKRCKKWVRKLFPDRDIRHYFYKVMASYLDKKNKIEESWIGGKNKNILLQIVKVWWGELLIDSTKVENTTSGVRFIIFNEEKSNPICKSQINTLKCRSLYLSNDISALNKNNKIFLIFDEHTTQEFEPEELLQMAEALFWLAVEYFPFYIKEGLVLPTLVEERIKEELKEQEYTYSKFNLLNLQEPLPYIDNIYLIKSGKRSLYKIGHSLEPNERLSKLSTGNPDKLVLLACCPGGVEKEAYFHNKYEDNLYRNEWFKFDKEEIEMVKKEFINARLYLD